MFSYITHVRQTHSFLCRARGLQPAGCINIHFVGTYTLWRIVFIWFSKDFSFSNGALSHLLSHYWGIYSAFSVSTIRQRTTWPLCQFWLKTFLEKRIIFHLFTSSSPSKLHPRPYIKSALVPEPNGILKQNSYFVYSSTSYLSSRKTQLTSGLSHLYPVRNEFHVRLSR
jgi:hypothetical protein